MACPFGTIIPAALQFRDSACDLCAGRADGLPDCAASCPLHAISVAEVPDDAEGVYVLGENLAVKTTAWQKAEAPKTS